MQPGFGQPWVGSRWMLLPVLVGRRVRSPRRIVIGVAGAVVGGEVGAGGGLVAGGGLGAGALVVGGEVGAGEPVAGGGLVAGGVVVAGVVVAGWVVVGWFGSGVPGVGGGSVSGARWNVNACSRVRTWSRSVRNLTSTSTVPDASTEGTVTSTPVSVTVPRTIARSPNQT